MKIAVIGTGNVGQALGARWAKVGHAVTFGSRNPDSERVQKLLATIDGSVAAAHPGTAAADADAVLLATPWTVTQSIVTDLGDLQNTILIDATNPLKPDLKGLDVGPDDSGGEAVARWATNARVVKAFNTTGANNMLRPDYGQQKAAMFVCGDDVDARQAVMGLATEIGFDAVDAGPLATARYLESLAFLWISLAVRGGFGREFAIGLLHR